ncbi:MAG: replication initiation protein [Prevotella sp.]|jgi:hypothetical protein|nr:replication initiation protein [Prevotella sp.]
MPKKKDEFTLMRSLLHIKHRNVRWSNFLIDSAIDCNLVEKRALYLISEWVKINFVSRNLGVPENWKELIMHFTDEDLGVIGGKKNIPRTYQALKQLGKKFIAVEYTNEKGQKIKGRIHWIDAFYYNTVTKVYDVRISPEILPYMINVKGNFTTIDIGEAMSFASKETQKMYEFACKYSGDYRYSDRISKEMGFNYAKNVVPVKMETLRNMLGLDEVKDERTGKIEKRGKYSNYNGIKKNVLEKAQKELYFHYKYGKGCIWFDFQEGPRKGLGGKVTTVFLYIYTRKNPKKGEDRPWQEGDEKLNPYEEGFEQLPAQTPQQKMHANPINNLPPDAKQVQLAQLLNKYLNPEEVGYYMRMAVLEGRKRKFNQIDSVMNVIQVIQDKEKQRKFKESTPAYRRNCLVFYVFTENLKRGFGWMIPPYQPQKKSIQNLHGRP